MEDLLANTESVLKKYISCKKTAQDNKEYIPSKSRTTKVTPELFQKKFLPIAAQIWAYRDLLHAIMRKAAIDVVVEDIETYYSNILPGHFEDLSSEGENFMLFAIAAKNRDRVVSISKGNFLAFCGDSKTNRISLYEYRETRSSDNFRTLYERRKRFREHALHLTDDHIDKFNFEEMIPYIERFINNELESIISRGEKANDSYAKKR
ncbi:hypothetical protein [Sphingobacterium tabacisoli]|uniref:MAE-28990/MAE-18760-like HEPN domain-containing protein n=1 Tax=Sphingobacterium tabacisoli TaxID=2044855 RepID=A0ABW5L8R8_9SPHI|nr:hypothetical protein [Sphingobacterium tabacisoli]